MQESHGHGNRHSFKSQLLPGSSCAGLPVPRFSLSASCQAMPCPPVPREVAESRKEAAITLFEHLRIQRRADMDELHVESSVYEQTHAAPVHFECLTDGRMILLLKGESLDPSSKR